MLDNKIPDFALMKRHIASVCISIGNMFIIDLSGDMIMNVAVLNVVGFKILEHRGGKPYILKSQWCSQPNQWISGILVLGIWAPYGLMDVPQPKLESLFSEVLLYN